MKILVADDELSIRAGIVFTLKAAGYETVEAANGRQVLELAATEQPDFYLLDIMMPELDGFEVCAELKKSPYTADKPIIMLTARTGTNDIVAGLATGADDYIVKPFSPIELLARVQAVARRTVLQTADATHQIHRGALLIDITRHTVTIGGNSVVLANKEFELLRILATDAGKLFTRDELIELVWGLDQYGDSRALDTHLKTLRKKLAVCPAVADALVTIRGVGCKLDL
ncbi:MAG: response regulator transcription factor [Negativicutes bacterium]|jgi:DNA-binding response OmpR family regulator